MSAWKSLFLPALLVAAVLTGLTAPAPGVWLDGQTLLGLPAQSWLIVAMFFLYGFKLRRSDLRVSGRFGPAAGAAVAISLVLGPLAGLATAKWGGAGEGLFIGLLAMACVPPTLTSAIVVTENAGGDAVWALMLTVLLTFAGILIMPFTLSWTLSMGVDLSLPVWPFMWKIMKLVLLPILAGKAVRLAWRGRAPAWLDLVPSVCVALVVWMPVSANAAALRGLSARAFGGLAGAALLVHGALLLAAWGGARPLLRLTGAEGAALMFVSAQKTLPLALTALAALPEGRVATVSLATATVVCVVFHFCQVLLDSALAGLLRRRLR